MEREMVEDHESISSAEHSTVVGDHNCNDNESLFLCDFSTLSSMDVVEKVGFF